MQFKVLHLLTNPNPSTLSLLTNNFTGNLNKASRNPQFAKSSIFVLTNPFFSAISSHTFFFLGTTSSGAAVLYALRPTPHGSTAACECAWGRPALRSVPVAFRAGSPRRTVLDGIAQIVRRTVCIFLTLSRYRLRGIGAGVFPPEIPSRRGGMWRVWVGHKFESSFLSKSDRLRTAYVARG